MSSLHSHCLSDAISGLLLLRGGVYFPPLEPGLDHGTRFGQWDAEVMLRDFRAQAVSYPAKARFFFWTPASAEEPAQAACCEVRELVQKDFPG